MTDNITRQVNIACPSCGSYYRQGDKCNICGNVIMEENSEPIPFVPKAPVGRLWNKRLHRYLTLNEIKAGMQGG